MKPGTPHWTKQDRSLQRFASAPSAATGTAASAAGCRADLVEAPAHEEHGHIAAGQHVDEVEEVVAVLLQGGST